MTKKDFEAIAHIVRNITDVNTQVTVACELSDYFASVNPNFNPAKFLTACAF